MRESLLSISLHDIARSVLYTAKVPLTAGSVERLCVVGSYELRFIKYPPLPHDDSDESTAYVIEAWSEGCSVKQTIRLEETLNACPDMASQSWFTDEQIVFWEEMVVILASWQKQVWADIKTQRERMEACLIRSAEEA